MPTIPREFGQFFRNRRKFLGLTLSEFCRQNGFDKGNVSRLERGLVKPPESPELLEAYANALNLKADSEDRQQFMGHAAIARGKLPITVSNGQAAAVEQLFRQMGRRLHDPWVKARNLELWSKTVSAQSELPNLVRQLIYATTQSATRIEMPGGDGVQRHGWDGIVLSPTGSRFVPEGLSVWEISVSSKTKSKAGNDFKARVKNPLGIERAEATFVYVTSCKWDSKRQWRDEKRKLGIWKNVEVYDSADLEAWLEIAPGVDTWLAEKLGRLPAGVSSIGDHWGSLSRLHTPSLKPEVFLASRRKSMETLKDFFLGTAGVLAIECRSPIEALDFVAAYLAWENSKHAECALTEEDRRRIQSRSVVVRDRIQWDGLSHANGELYLLPTPSLSASLSDEELNSAVRHGHRALISSTQFANHRGGSIILERPTRYDLEKSLRESGIDQAAAVKAARAAGGSLSVLNRHLSSGPGSNIPNWCRNDRVAEIVPLLLAGAWDEYNDVDRAVLTRLSRRSYDEIAITAKQFANVEDAPLTWIETRWRLVSPEDAWSLKGELVTDLDLDRFDAIALEVLSQDDQSLCLPANESIWYSLKHQASEKVASPQLRRGIAETIAILGCEFGSIPKNVLSTNGKYRAMRIVRTLLTDAPSSRWASLDLHLPMLAEAAPDEFLSAIKSDLKKEHPELAKVFSNYREACNHPGLLRALETMAWSSELFSKVCSILGELAELHTGDESQNGPLNCLIEILLPWYPQTTANVEKRISFMTVWAKRVPDIAWKMLRDLISTTRTTTMPINRPVWREWGADWVEGSSVDEFQKLIEAAAELIIELVEGKADRWPDAIDELQSLPDTYRDKLLERLISLPKETFSPDDRKALAKFLRKKIQIHREFSNAEWSFPKETIDRLEQALQHLLQDEPIERHAWLFSTSINLRGFREDHKGKISEIERLQGDALSEVFDHYGIEGILRLAQIAESPCLVGRTMARVYPEMESQILPKFLESTELNIQTFARCFAAERIRQVGLEWIRSMPLERWNPQSTAMLLAEAPFKEGTWKVVDELSVPYCNQYWKSVAPTTFGLDTKQCHFACQKLLEFDRFEAAIVLLSGVPYNHSSASPSIVMDTLEAFSKRNLASQPNAEILSTIRDLIGWLQDTVPYNNDEPTRRLAQLEWAYLSLLNGFDASPRTLMRIISDDPLFFAHLIRLVFRPKNEVVTEPEPSEELRRKAKHAYRLLMNWKQIPGCQSDGTIDGEQLLQWIEAARSLCRDSGHLEVGDYQIGSMLANGPKPEDDDADWPCEVVRDAIEEADSDDLYRGFFFGALNSGGVTVRSPMDGGAIEHKKAKKYRNWANRCDPEWPRVATSLRKIAEEYEAQAEREDKRAAERANHRH